MTTDIVLGAGSGMGEAVARRLAARGGRLLLADLDLAAVERLAVELGGAAEAHACDLASVEDLERLAATAGGFDALVLTAGLSPTMGTGPRIVEVDLVGPARLLEVFAPLAAAGSVAVLLSSMAGHAPLPFAPEVDAALDDPLAPDLVERLDALGAGIEEPGIAYVVAKRGLLRLVRRSAAAWGARGARILSISPGVIDTPMGRQENEAQPVMADLVASSPLGRMLEADEVAAVAEFLVSPAASGMTGSDVLVDGGAVSTFG